MDGTWGRSIPSRCNGSWKQATRNPQQAVINFGPRRRGGYRDIANDTRRLASVLADGGGAALTSRFLNESFTAGE